MKPLENTSPAAARIAATLGLTPIPIEGGLLGQTWQDEHSSAIVFLITQSESSGLHALPHPEVWFFHGGDPASMLLLHPDGSSSEPVLGMDLENGERPQIAIPPGTTMAAETTGEWSLLGTYMAPPYVETDVVYPRSADLEGVYPDAAERIRRLARR